MSPAEMKAVPDNPTAVGKSSRVKKNSMEQNSNKKKLLLTPQLENQLRIAKLIDSAHKEDPKLKEKLKQVVETTQMSFDEAFIALHDSDYDVNKAINKLLEGEDKMLKEWSTLSKKKKTKEEKKLEINAVDTNEGIELDVRKLPVDSKSSYTKSKGRGRGVLPRKSDKSPSKRVFINSKFEARTHVVQEACCPQDRPRKNQISSINTWDPKRPVSDLLARGGSYELEDEYMGSLSRGLVITSSNFGRNSDRLQDKERRLSPSRNSLEPQQPAGREQGITEQVTTPEKSYVELKKPTEQEKQAEQKQPVPRSSPEPKSPQDSKDAVSPGKPVIGSKAPPITATVVKAPPRSERPPLPRQRSPSIPSNKSSVSGSTKPPPVEMPPDQDNALEMLDITFGAIDLEDTSGSSSELFFSQKKNTTSLADNSSSENICFVKEQIVDKNIYESCVNNTSSSTIKTNQKSKSFHYSPHDATASSGFSSPCMTGTYSSALAARMPYLNVPNSNTVPYYQSASGCQTCTSTCHFPSSGLSSPSFSAPYPSYSSMVQGQKPQVTSTFVSDLEGMTNLMGFPGVTSSTNTTTIANKEGGKVSPGGGKGVSSVQQLMGLPHSVILGQGGVTYYQPPVYFQEVQGRSGHHIPFYEVNYAGSSPRGDGQPAAFQAPPPTGHGPPLQPPEHHQLTFHADIPATVHHGSQPQPLPGICQATSEPLSRRPFPPPFQSVSPNQFPCSSGNPVPATQLRHNY